MRFGKKAGRILSAALLVLLCVLTGVFSGCDEESGQKPDSLMGTDTVYSETDTLYTETDTVYSETDASYGQTDGSMDTEKYTEPESSEDGNDSAEDPVVEDGTYTSPEQVALYLHRYGHLPSNYITKKEAEAAGWDSSKGNLWDVADGMSIGGSRFGNYEGDLPDKEGRKWYECDVNYEGGYRGAERLLYSNDGLIYYTGDHYKTFEQLY